MDIPASGRRTRTMDIAASVHSTAARALMPSTETTIPMTQILRRAANDNAPHASRRQIPLPPSWGDALDAMASGAPDASFLRINAPDRPRP